MNPKDLVAQTGRAGLLFAFYDSAWLITHTVVPGTYLVYVNSLQASVAR